ncbi:MFS transporter [Lysinimonas soli]|uniref:MFS transporter n=1 Tax=Lysinimonas soli TaxID=1074233 RepID=A0ABW0NR86_9MICO
MSAEGSDSRFPLFRLLVITGAIFVAVSSEFLPTGLLPDIAAELHVSESRVGLLVTIFALTVVVSTAPLTALTHRFPRKWLMVTMLGVFAVANFLAAISPSYEFLAGARVLGGLAHGLFWSVTGPYASRIVPQRQLSRALAVTNAGGTAAFILGVPFGTALGHALGWRLAFAVMGGVVLVFLLLVVLALPHVSHLVTLKTGEIALPLRQDRTVPAVVIVSVTILLLAVGQNAYYTYIVPWATQVGGIPAGDVSALLFGYGAAGAFGLLIAGLLGDRFPRGALLILALSVAVTVAALGIFGAASPVIVVIGMIAWSVAFGGIPSLLQGRMMHSASLRLRDTAAAWTTISFNVAIGGGAFLGGLLLDGFGIRVLPWVEVAFVLAGMLFVVLSDRRRMGLLPLHVGR